MSSIHPFIPKTKYVLAPELGKDQAEVPTIVRMFKAALNLKPSLALCKYVTCDQWKGHFLWNKLTPTIVKSCGIRIVEKATTAH